MTITINFSVLLDIGMLIALLSGWAFILFPRK